MFVMGGGGGGGVGMTFGTLHGGNSSKTIILLSSQSVGNYLLFNLIH